jgi:hypothetical protein
MITTICKILQITLWTGIIFGFDTTLNLFMYFAYLICQFLCPTLRYLYNQRKFHKIDEYMGEIFNNPPEIELKVECYHYETQYITKRDSKGKTSTKSEEKKIISLEQMRKFKFYSWRDVSGQFILHCESPDTRKSLVRLEIDTNIDFADPESKTDYQRQYDSFYNEFKNHDDYINITAKRYVPGCTEHNLVIVNERNIPVLSCLVYVLLTFLTLVEFYKYYIEQYCLDQKFTLKKIVSTRQSLNNPEIFQRWQTHIPTLRIYDQPAIVYNTLPPLMHDSSILPTLEEIHGTQ